MIQLPQEQAGRPRSQGKRAIGDAGLYDVDRKVVTCGEMLALGVQASRLLFLRCDLTVPSEAILRRFGGPSSFSRTPI